MIGWESTWVLIAAAALHPSMHALTERMPDARRGRVNRARLAVLSLAILVAPVSVLLHGGRSDPLSAVGVGVLTTLSLWRLARLLIERERHAEQQVSLVRLGETAARADDVDGLLEAAAAEVARMLRGDAAAVVRVGNDLVVRSCVGAWDERLPHMLPASAAPQQVATPYGPVVAVVIGDPADPYGAILVDAPRRLGSDDIAALRVVGNLLSATVQRHHAEAALRHASLHDALTGLPNRVLLEDRLQAASRRARRAGRPYGVLFVDLDGFKAVNDTLGHGAGDAVLVTTASRLVATVRGVDTVARVSGDEFVVILDDVGSEQLELVTGRVLAAVSPPVAVASGVAKVTASIGAVLVRPDDDPEAALQAADAAMYRAKHDGKARVSVVV